MKATGPGMVIGRALDSYAGAGVGKVNVFVASGWVGSSTQVAVQNGTGFSSLAVQGPVTIDGPMTVKGHATFEGGLLVKGETVFEGSVRFGSVANNISIDKDGALTRTGTASTNNAVEPLGKVKAAKADAVKADAVCSTAPQDIATGLKSPDVPRIVTITDGKVDGTAGTVTVEGTLADGTKGSDRIVIDDGGTATGVKAFAKVTKVTLPGGCSAPATLSVGTGDKLGLANSLHGQNTVYKVTRNKEDITVPAVDAENSTVDLGPITDGDEITVWYKY